MFSFGRKVTYLNVRRMSPKKLRLTNIQKLESRPSVIQEKFKNQKGYSCQRSRNIWFFAEFFQKIFLKRAIESPTTLKNIY